MSRAAAKLELVEQPKKPRASRSGLDPETRELRRILLAQDKLRAKQLELDRELKLALRRWSDSRPGERGGIATEAGARFLFERSGLIKR